MNSSGRLTLVDLPPLGHVDEFIDLALAALIHHGYAVHVPLGPSGSQSTISGMVSSQTTVASDAKTARTASTAANKTTNGDSTLPEINLETLLDMPPLTLMGHNYGALIAFELAREFEKSISTTRVNFNKLIVSAARPPQVHIPPPLYPPPLHLVLGI